MKKYLVESTLCRSQISRKKFCCLVRLDTLLNKKILEFMSQILILQGTSLRELI